MSKISLPKARRLARQAAMQAVFPLAYKGAAESGLSEQYLISYGLGQADRDYFESLVGGICDYQVEIDQAIDPLCAQPVSEMATVELSILRLAVFELMHRPDIPYKVVINEALELQKVYGSEEGKRFVNGILDRLSKKIRDQERS
jgi:N utilization substance protein B